MNPFSLKTEMQAAVLHGLRKGVTVGTMVENMHFIDFFIYFQPDTSELINNSASALREAAFPS